MELADAIRKAKRVYIIGNGGSYANAVHIVNDLLSCGIKAYAMDPATLTAFSNDHGYDTVFERWLLVVGEKGDLLIALSGSGQSPNIVKAIITANSMGMDTWALIGDFKDRGIAGALARHVTAYGKGMQSAEAAQVIIGHEAFLCLRDS